MKKTYLLLLLAGLLFGCRPEAPDAEQVAREQAQRDSAALKVALVPTMDCLPFYYAQAIGLYDRLGLDVRLYTYTALADCDTALVSGHVDIAYTDLIRATLLKHNGHDLRVLWRADGKPQLITARTKRIKRLRQLKERMVLVARHSVTDFYSDAVTESAGIERTDIFRPQVNDIRLRCAMLCNGTVDAALLPEPYATQARMEGNPCLLGREPTGLPALMAWMIRAEVHNNPTRIQQARLLLAGYNRAVEELNHGAQSDTLRALWTRLYELSGAAIDSIQLPRFQPAAPARIEDWDMAVAWLKTRDLLPAVLPTDTLLLRNALFHD